MAKSKNKQWEQKYDSIPKGNKPMDAIEPKRPTKRPVPHVKVNKTDT